MREINTNELKARVKLKIDGHEYIVRRMGAGEQLQMNILRREHNEVIKKIDDKDSSKEVKDKAVSDMDNYQIKMLDMFAKLFNDGGDGSKSKDLVYSLDILEITEMLAEIFEEELRDVETETTTEDS